MCVPQIKVTDKTITKIVKWELVVKVNETLERFMSPNLVIEFKI